MLTSSSGERNKSSDNKSDPLFRAPAKNFSLGHGHETAPVVE